MMRDVKKQLEEISKLTGKTIDQVKQSLELDFYCGTEVANRSSEGKVNSVLRELQEKAKAESVRRERLSGYHWTKDEGEWVVAGNFTGKNIGDVITIVKASGEKQERLIVDFIKGGIYAKVK